MTSESAEYMIGESSLTLVYLEDIADGMPEPNSQFSEFAEFVETADGHEKGLGQPTTEWTFGLLTQAQRDALREYCPGYSSNVAIRTRINDAGDYKVYTAIMKWPKPADERWDATRFTELVITFQYLVLIDGLY